MLRLEKLSKSFGDKVILASADLVVHSGERVGLIGPNGTGKTTLLRMMAGELEPEGGEIIPEGRPRIGMLRQELANTEATILQETLAGHEELTRLRQERQVLRQQLDNHHQTETIQRLGEVECRLENLGTYDAEARAAAILQGLGFATEQLARPVSAFSGGWRMRVALAQALFASPDLLLLDEPTNHLDLESVAWLEGFLSQWRGALLIISHNRTFLNRTVGIIVEMEDGRLTRYVGNFDQYLEQKAQWLESERKQAVQQQKKIEHLERFIQRFRAKATKARQVQSRIKALARMERVEITATTRATPVLRLPPPLPCHRQVVTARNFSYYYESEKVFAGAEFAVGRGDKVGLLGVNGSGKSTLLKVCAGLLPGHGGVLRLGEQVKAAYFAQHALESLDPRHSVLASLQEATAEGVTGVETRTLLGGFLFAGDDAFKPVSVLSGGERARLALARLFVSGANLLLLDEPTNHLDMEARSALAEVLSSYAGTLVMVSHDQELLESVCDRFWLVGQGLVTPWEEDLDTYLAESTARRSNQGERPAAGNRRKDTRRLAAEVREMANRRLRPLRSQCSDLENRIHALESEHKTLETLLADPTVYEDAQRPRLTAALERNNAITQELAKAMATWETLSLAIDELERDTRERIEALA